MISASGPLEVAALRPGAALLGEHLAAPRLVVEMRRPAVPPERPDREQGGIGDAASLPFRGLDGPDSRIEQALDVASLESVRRGTFTARAERLRLSDLDRWLARNGARVVTS